MAVTSEGLAKTLDTDYTSFALDKFQKDVKTLLEPFLFEHNDHHTRSYIEFVMLTYFSEHLRRGNLYGATIACNEHNNQDGVSPMHIDLSVKATPQSQSVYIGILFNNTPLPG